MEKEKIFNNGRTLNKIFYDYIGTNVAKDASYYMLYLLWNDGTYESAALLSDKAQHSLSSYIDIGSHEDYVTTSLNSIKVFYMDSVIFKK